MTELTIEQQLANVLAAHRDWVESDGEAGTQLDLSGANLRSANLHSANLSGANLGSVDMYATDLRRARLDSVDLRGTKLIGVNLTGTNLSARTYRREPDRRELKKVTPWVQGVGIAPSIGTVADAYDNAMAESVISSFKNEEITQNGPWKKCSEVELATLTWVDWYNKSRLHGALKYLPPIEFEESYLKASVPQ